MLRIFTIEGLHGVKDYHQTIRQNIYDGNVQKGALVQDLHN